MAGGLGQPLQDPPGNPPGEHAGESLGKLVSWRGWRVCTLSLRRMEEYMVIYGQKGERGGKGYKVAEQPSSPPVLQFPCNFMELSTGGVFGNPPALQSASPPGSG